MRIRTALLFLLAASGLPAADHPNILWISAEDHGPHLGCYGDSYATTPNLDDFAGEALRYTRASSNAPVCAAARTTLISGMYAPSTGSQHMRSIVPAPGFMRFFPAYLRDAGYYTSNNAKEDYNLRGAEKGWDDSSQTAHWRNRPEGKPFFAVFNVEATHESRIRNENPDPVHDPALAPLPPYHPDTPEVRKDWAQYYDRLTEADAFFGEKLAELEDAGLAEDTIVFYWADHGSGMPRSKRYPGWSGLHVPLLVHFPEKWKQLAPKDYREGASSDRLVGFIDFAPTLLSIAGVPVPAYYQGHAFAGPQQTPDPEYSFGFRGRMDERPDFCRSVTDGRHVYIRNFYPHLPHGQYVAYQQETPTTAVWYRMFREGRLNEVQSAFWKPHPREELYDLLKDPHETRNLARDPASASAKDRLSEALDRHLVRTGDLGFIPEPMLHARISRGMLPMQLASEILPTPAGDGNPALYVLRERAGRESFRKGLADENVLVRYWTAIRLLAPGNEEMAGELEGSLASLLDDEEPAVAVAAAECLARNASSTEPRESAVARLMDLAAYPGNDFFLTIHALNSLDHLREAGVEIPESVRNLERENDSVPQAFGFYRGKLIDRF